MMLIRHHLHIWRGKDRVLLGKHMYFNRSVFFYCFSGIILISITLKNSIMYSICFVRELGFNSYLRFYKFLFKGSREILEGRVACSIISQMWPLWYIIGMSLIWGCLWYLLGPDIGNSLKLALILHTKVNRGHKPQSTKEVSIKRE